MRVIVIQPVQKFFSGLNGNVTNQIRRNIALLEEQGKFLGMPHAKKISKNLYELRILGEQQIRIFFSYYFGDAILLHGFVKKSNRIPQRELETALRRLKALT